MQDYTGNAGIFKEDKGFIKVLVRAWVLKSD